MARDAYAFIKTIVADGGSVLFVGTKRSARDAIRSQAERCEMPFVSYRWLGGMLTNYKTVRQSVKRLKELEQMAEDGSFEKITKKEGLGLKREQDKLERSLGGIKQMNSLPDVLFVVDVDHEDIAVREARKLGIPVVAVVDTNCSPDGVDYIIPGNDDAMRAITLYSTLVADAVVDGKASLPEVALGEDEFVELDKEGKPKKASARKRPAAKKASRTTKKVVVKKPAEKAVDTSGADKSADAVEKNSTGPEAVKPAAAIEKDSTGPEADKPAAAVEKDSTGPEADKPAAAVEKDSTGPEADKPAAAVEKDSTDPEADKPAAVVKKEAPDSEAVKSAESSAKAVEKEAVPVESAEKEAAPVAAAEEGAPAAEEKASAPEKATKKAATKKAATKKVATKKAATGKAAPKTAAAKKTATKKAAAKKTAAKAEDQE